MKKWEKQLAKARKLLAEGKRFEAEKAFLEAVNESSRHDELINFALCLQELGALQADTGSFEEAESALLRALKIRETTHGPVHAEVAETLTSLGKLYAPFESVEAEKLLKRAISIYHEDNSPLVLYPMEHLSLIFLLRGRRDERRQLLEDLLQYMQTRENVDPPLLGRSLLLLAQFFEDENQEKTEELLLQALPHLKNADKFAEQEAQAALMLGKIKFRQKLFADAEANFKLALLRADSSPQTATTVTVEILSRLARLHMIVARDYSGAESLLSRAVDICKSETPPLSNNNAIVEFERLCEITGKLPPIESLRKEILLKHKAISNGAPEKCDVNDVASNVSTESLNIARLLCQQDKFDEAEEFALAAVKVDEAVNSPKLVSSLMELANVYVLSDRHGEAGILFDRILDMKDGKNWFFPNLVDALKLALLLGRTIDARKLEVIAESLVEQFASNHEWCSGLSHRLALVYAVAGQDEKARLYSKRALKAIEGHLADDALTLSFTLEGWAAQFHNARASELSKACEERAKEIRSGCGHAAKDCSIIV